MPTLVLHTPTWRVRADGARSFESTVARRVGEGYALTADEQNRIRPGWKVIVLNRYSKQQAEGVVVRLERTKEWTMNGLQRFDVYMDQLRVVPYRLTTSVLQLNRRGTAIVSHWLPLRG